MGKRKRKLSAAEKEEKKRRQKECMTIFINGKQKRVKRPPTIGGMDIEEFIRRNADPIWLHQNEMWEYIGDEDLMGEAEIEKLWIDEAIRRDEELDKGSAKAYPADEVLTRARARRK